MTVESLFFNSAPGDPRTYQASDFASYFGDVLSTGLLSVDEDAGNVVEHIEDLTVNVTPGQTIMKGYKGVNDGTELTLALPSTSLDRIDRIVYRLDLRNQSRFIELAVKQGDDAETPEPPELQRDNVIYEISLAQIFLTRNTTTISQTDITDERLNEELCGLTSSLITVPTQQFLDQWNLFFNNTTDEIDTEKQELLDLIAQSLVTAQEELDQYKGDLSDKIDGFEGEWQEWFDNIQEESYVTGADLTAHETADEPHEYGERYAWKYNSSTDTLDLVVK